MGSTRRLSGTRIVILLLLLGAGSLASLQLSRILGQQLAADEQSRAEQAARQMTATFMLLLDVANGPLRSLATLFNGSGRVSDKEFAATVEFIQSQGTPLPGGLGFLMPSSAAGCETPGDCWVVVYSTNADGLLKPGAQLSRFGPTNSTIAAALTDEDTLKIGPAFSQPNGEQSSFCAVTIRNTRQFGMLVSRVDYAALVAQLFARWAIDGLQLRLEGAFPDGQGMTDFALIFGTPAAAPGTVRSIVLTDSGSFARFRFTWDVAPGFSPAAGRWLPGALLGAGMLITALVTLLVGLWLTRYRGAG
jgi:Tfp pilus assembly protein PilV